MSLDNPNNAGGSKRIVKNTIFLYFRMLFTMAVTLYTSRVVLDVLGEEDFGVFIVVGGVVTLFSFLNSAMSSGTQRFLSYELGTGNKNRLNEVFCSSLNIHILISLIIFLLAETVGIWFLNNKLNIPEIRMEAVNWIYQFSVLSLIITVIQVPYSACIISREKMNIYAYISIFDVFLKLIIVFILPYASYDKLKVYAGLLFIVTLITNSTYAIYCRQNFPECKYIFSCDKDLFKKLTSFAGWNLFGAVATVSTTQGANILLNIFFGPIVNSARGIAFQSQAAVNSFVSSFQIAVNPQIVKSYAQKDYGYMTKLIFQSSKYSFFLLLILCTPLLFENEFILSLWLKKVPENSSLFCKLVLINALVDTFSGALITANRATGRIRNYQVVVGVLLFLNLPVSYLFLKLGALPQAVFYISIVISLIILFARMYMLNKVMVFDWIQFGKDVVIKSCFVALISCLIPFGIIYFMQDSFYRLLIIAICTVLVSPIIIYLIGLSKNEKEYVLNKYKSLKLKFRA